MKKFGLVLAVALAVGTMSAWSATIGITVNAATKLDVAVDAATWTIALDNTGAAIDVANQGTLTVKSTKSAYTVTFSSSNSGTLVNGTNTIAYKIKVDTSGWTTGVQTNDLSSYTQLTAAKTIVFKQKTPVAGKSFNIGFNIPVYTDYYVDGAYTDTVTISISAS